MNTNHTSLNYVMGFIAVLLIYCALFLFIDRSLAFYAHGFFNTPVYEAARLISHLGNSKIWFMGSVVVTIIFIVLSLFQFQFSSAWRKFFYVFFSVFVAALVGAFFKYTLARYRPDMLFDHDLYGFHFFSNKGDFNSTPSGHALSIFAACTALSILFKRYAILFFTVAVLVALSRVMLTAHYLSDVVFGAYIGIMSALLCSKLRFFSEHR